MAKRLVVEMSDEFKNALRIVANTLKEDEITRFFWNFELSFMIERRFCEMRDEFKNEENWSDDQIREASKKVAEEYMYCFLLTSADKQ